jgi:hypothetical protein
MRPPTLFIYTPAAFDPNGKPAFNAEFIAIWGSDAKARARPRTCTAAAAACRCGERCGVRSVQRRFEIFGKICRRDFAGTLLVSSFQSVQCFLDAHNWALELKQNEIVSKSR